MDRGTPRQQGSQADTRGLEKPDALGGTALKWRDWKVVTSSCAVACHEVLAGLMTKAEETGDPVFNATFVNNEAREASTKRGVHLGEDLLSSCCGPGDQRRAGRRAHSVAFAVLAL